MKQVIISLLCIVCLSSCISYKYISTEPETKRAFIGASESSIIRAKGAPDREVSDGAGGRILVYERYYSNSNTYYYGYGFSNTSTRQNRNYTEIYINEDGICYDVRTNLANKQIEWGKTILYNLGYVVAFVGTYWLIMLL